MKSSSADHVCRHQQESVDTEAPEGGGLRRRRTIKKKKRVSSWDERNRHKGLFLLDRWVLSVPTCCLHTANHILTGLPSIYFPPHRWILLSGLVFQVVSFRVKTTLPRMPKPNPVRTDLL